MTGILNVLTAVACAALVSACSGAGRTDGGPSAGPDARSDAPSATPSVLPGFPMPAAPAGEQHVAGPITHDAAGADQKADCSGAATVSGGRIAVSVTSVRLNCCTETLRAGVERSGPTVVVRLYEYLPDLCECTHRRNVAFALTGLDGVETIEIRLNDRPGPVAVIRP